MIKINTKLKEYEQCNSCLSQENVVYISVGTESSTTSLKLCKNCRYVLSLKLRELEEDNYELDKVRKQLSEAIDVIKYCKSNDNPCRVYDKCHNYLQLNGIE